MTTRTTATSDDEEEDENRRNPKSSTTLTLRQPAQPIGGSLRAAISFDDMRKLESALDELSECRKLLDASSISRFDGGCYGARPKNVFCDSLADQERALHVSAPHRTALCAA